MKLNAAQRLAFSLGLPHELPKHENGGFIGSGRPTKYRVSPPRRRMAWGNTDLDTRAGAFVLASLKYDGAIKVKPANGVRETRRELAARLNWLRERMAEEAAS